MLHIITKRREMGRELKSKEQLSDTVDVRLVTEIIDGPHWISYTDTETVSHYYKVVYTSL